MAGPVRKKGVKTSGGQKVPVPKGKSGRMRAVRGTSGGTPTVKDKGAEKGREEQGPPPVPKTKSGGFQRQRKRGAPGPEPRGARASDGDRSGGVAIDLGRAGNFRRGLPIAVKFAIPTSATVAFFMALLGYLTYNITYREVDQQINEKGIAIATTVAASCDRDLWEVPAELIEEGHPPETLEKILEDRREPILRNLNRDFQAIVGGKMSAVAAKEHEQEIINILLVRNFRGSSPRALASGKGDASVRLEDQKVLKTENGVEIVEGRYSGGKLDRVRTRQYTLPIDLGPDVPESRDDAVLVFVRADRIDDVTSNLRTKIAMITGVGAIAGIILAVIIAMVLTGPIRSLERDIHIVSRGDLTHQTVPASRDEIGALAHSFNVMTANLHVAQEAALEREAIERELQIATEIQTKLLPERIPQIPGVDIHSFYESAKEVGGDYYDFLILDQQHLGIIVADVSGKGIPGSMVMTMFRSLVRLASVRNTSPSDTLKKVNRILAKDIRRGMFVTAVYMILDVQSKTLRVASAGHNPSVLYRASTGQVELVNPQGIALGFDKGPVFDNHIREQEIVLEKGDRIAAYTDGVTEAMNEAGDEFGDEPFYELVRQHAKGSSKEFVDSVVGALERHRGRGEQSDDITITTLAIQ